MTSFEMETGHAVVLDNPAGMSFPWKIWWIESSEKWWEQHHPII